jgi:hypothetical protein
LKKNARVNSFQTALIFPLVSPFLFSAQRKFSACPETFNFAFYYFETESHICKWFSLFKHTKTNMDASKTHLEGIAKAHTKINVKNREKNFYLAMHVLRALRKFIV